MNPKQFFLGGATALTALALSYVFSVLLRQTSVLLLSWSLALALLFLVLLVLQTVFVADGKTALILLAVQSAALTSFFLYPFSYLAALFGLAAFLLFFLAHKVGQSRLKNNLKISFSELRRHALPILSLTLAAFLIGVYVASLEKQRPITVSREAVAVIIRPLAPLAARFIPEFNLQSSVGDFLESFAARIYGPQIDSRLAAGQLTESINQLTGAAVLFHDDLTDAGHKIINSLLAETSVRQQRPFILIWALFIFLLLSGGLYFVNIVVALLAWLVYELLLAGGFGYIVLEKAEKEVIELGK